MPHDEVSKIIARAWRDPAFKAKLLCFPRATLAEAGVVLPAGVKVKVVQDRADVRHLVMPRTPDNMGGLSDHELEGLARQAVIAQGMIRDVDADGLLL